jgi:bifunctional non-homologous end joining protein LigD
MAIEEYRRKRDFARTPEPAPAEVERAGRAFVVHRHEARRLHYDLRLEAGTVLACFAVPKGFSYDPADKRLAVHTEDHPLEYEKFSGVIPRGQYGAGTMQIWDAGTYELIKGPKTRGGPPDINTALAKGELKLVLKGQRLRGEWHMVQTKREGGRDWLLFKARDRYAGSGSDLFAGLDLGRAKRGPAPARVKLMEPGAEAAPFSDPDWMFEPAFPGRRVLVSVSGEAVTLRCGTDDLAAAVPRIARELASVRADAALFDGVLVGVDDKGRPDEQVLAAGLESGGDGLLLYLSDVLYAEEWDLRALPLRERKTALRNLVPELRRVLTVDPIAERGQELAGAAAAAGLAAIIAKRAEAPYRAGPSVDWRLVPATAATAASTPRRAAAAGARRGPRSAGGDAPAISNPRKVYWPEQGYTKGDLVAYYDRVADLIVPYIRERPLHLYRWPDGVRGKSFYQKQLPELPDWVDTVNVAGEDEEPVRYIVCGDRRTLLYVINLGSIDLHPWFSRRGSLDSPDWAVLDLDPKEAPFASVIRIAREAGKLLRGLGLEPYLKTSGSSGLHVFVPLAPGYSYEHSRMFAEAVARLLVRDNGEIATVERSVGRREGKVYVDFLQNRREQTVVPPYVARPVEAASVSMPLEWDELESDFAVADFTIANAPARLARTGDLFRPALERPQDLGPAIEALGKYL